MRLVNKTLWETRPSHVQGFTTGQRVVQGAFPLESAGRVLLHEVHHNLGMRHKEMADIGTFSMDFLRGVTVRERVPKQAPSPDVVRERKLVMARTRLVGYERRLAYFQKLYAGKMVRARRSIAALERPVRWGVVPSKMRAVAVGVELGVA